jgi:pilus assembly protein CpaB
LKIQRPNIKINKTWLMLIAAIVLALLTTWLTLQYLTKKEQSIEEAVKARSAQNTGATVSVVVPIKAMQAGIILDASSVAARSVPADFIYSDTITVADFDGIKGNVLIRSVEKGKPLRRGDVQEVFADFSGSLKAGKRAMTINVDEINSVSHMVEPGNMVDLMLVLSAGGDAGGSSNQTVVPFLDQVKVLATGQKVTHDDSAMQGSEGRKVSYSNITLEVTPTQAARLALATELGKIRAVLRNENDKQSVDFDSVTANNLMEDIRERERRAASARPRSSTPGAYVEYLIGGKNSSDAVAPIINIPMSGGIPGQVSADPGTGGGAAPNATAAAPQTLTDLVKLSLGNSAAPAKSTK